MRLNNIPPTQASQALNPEKRQAYKKLLRAGELRKPPAERDFDPSGEVSFFEEEKTESDRKPQLVEPDSFRATDPIQFALSLLRPTYQERRVFGAIDAVSTRGAQERFSIETRDDLLDGTFHAFLRRHWKDHLYVNPNLFVTNSRHKITKSHFHEIRALALDIDFYKGDDPPQDPEDWILEQCRKYDLPKPHFIIHSSNLGRQVVWNIFPERPRKGRKDFLKKVSQVREKLTNHVFYPFADAQNRNPIQNIRLPGSFNHKPDRDHYKVHCKRISNPDKVTFHFFDDFFCELYTVTPWRDEGHSENYVADVTQAVERHYRKHGPGDSGNYYPTLDQWTVGYALYKKDQGKDQVAIERELLAWYVDHNCEPDADKINDLIDEIFAGDLHWSAKVADEYIPLSFDQIRSAYSELIFEKPESTYMSKSQTLEALAKYVLERYKGASFAESFRGIAKSSNTAESSIRLYKNQAHLGCLFVINDTIIGFRVENGVTTCWWVLEDGREDLAKKSLNTGRVRGEDQVLVQEAVAKRKKREKKTMKRGKERQKGQYSWGRAVY